MKKYIALLLSIILITILSCEKEITDNDMNLNPDPLLTSGDIQVVNGILVFKNDFVLNETLNKIAAMSIDEYNEWIGHYGFLSLQSIYHEIINEEDKLDNQFETTLVLSTAPQEVQHSYLYMKYLSMGLIREIIDKQDNSKYYELNISFPWLSSILNIDGIFMVGKSIYQCAPDLIKIWENGNVNSLELLKKVTQETNDIKFVIKEKTQSEKSTFSPNPVTSGWVYKEGIRRIRIDVYFETWQYLGDGTVWKYEHYYNVKSQKKNFWGNWKYNWTDMSIKGSWDGDFDYSDPSNPLWIRQYYFSAVYPSNYPLYYHIYASDLYSSHDIFDGSVEPYPTTWSLSYYIGGQYVKIWDVSLYNLNWEAIGHVDAVATIP